MNAGDWPGIPGGLDIERQDDTVRELQVRRAAADAELSQCLAVLEFVEWRGHAAMRICPACRAWGFWGHKPDCPLEAAISRHDRMVAAVRDALSTNQKGSD